VAAAVKNVLKELQETYEPLVEHQCSQVYQFVALEGFFLLYFKINI